jgi:hypothetical protein
MSDQIVHKLQELIKQLNSATLELSKAVKETDGQASVGPEDLKVREKLKKILVLQAKCKSTEQELLKETGLSEAQIDSILYSELPELEKRYIRQDVLKLLPTASFDDILPFALENILSHINPNWLREEAEKGFQLDEQYLREPLQVVWGKRIYPSSKKPQAFAHALLLCKDHIERKDELDFWALPMMAAEIATLGTRIDQIQELGEEATNRLKRLPVTEDEEVSSTIFEILVGLACLKKGLVLEMLPADRSRKTPEYRIHNFSVPAVIECKRRRTFSHVYLEAKKANRLFLSVLPYLQNNKYHVKISVDFFNNPFNIQEAEFKNIVLDLLPSASDGEVISKSWGRVEVNNLPQTMDFSRTRLYSPYYLEKVFGYNENLGNWDGLICVVDSPLKVIVDKARNPNCLQWRSLGDQARQKKARGVAQLISKALNQIPAGEMGIVYICYEEGGLDIIADSRTERIINELAGWKHRWTINIPLIVISRLYPRALGVGVPDLVESSLLFLAGSADKIFLAQFPNLIFTL